MKVSCFSANAKCFQTSESENVFHYFYLPNMVVMVLL